MADFFKECNYLRMKKHIPIISIIILSAIVGYCAKEKLIGFTGDVGNLVLLAIVFITFITSKCAATKVKQSDFWFLLVHGADFVTLTTLSLYIGSVYYDTYPYLIPLGVSVMTFICMLLTLNLFESQQNTMPIAHDNDVLEKKTDEKNILSKDDYDRLFNANKIKSQASLREAIDIRKFEIELYWKRTTYFWALIAAIFVGFFTVCTGTGERKQDVLVILCCLGLVFSFAWVLVNKGSKYWQENWEKHVDLLEDEHIGPLYKVYFSKDSSSPFSVSKINELVSIFVCTLWGILLLNALWPIHPGLKFNIFYFLLAASAIGICIIMYGTARSQLAGKEYIINIRNKD